MDITNTQNQLLKVTGELAVEQEKTHAMLEALEAVEWSDIYAGMMTLRYCNLCGENEHTTDCQLAAALRLARGEQ